MVYWFVAKKGRPIPAGAIASFVINVPDNWTMENAIAFAKQNNYGTPGRVAYNVVPLAGIQEAALVCAQQYLGDGASVNPSQPVLSQAHVQGGQPTGQPVAQPGQNRPAGEVGPGGFQVLSDADMSAADDSIYGGADDGTYTDLINGGIGSVEVARPG